LRGRQIFLLDTKAWFDSIHSTIRFVLPVKTLPNFYDNTMILLIIAMAIFVEGKEDICGGERRHLRLEIIGGVDERARG